MSRITLESEQRAIQRTEVALRYLWSCRRWSGLSILEGGAGVAVPVALEFAPIPELPKRLLQAGVFVLAMAIGYWAQRRAVADLVIAKELTRENRRLTDELTPRDGKTPDQGNY